MCIFHYSNALEIVPTVFMFHVTVGGRHEIYLPPLQNNVLEIIIHYTNI